MALPAIRRIEMQPDAIDGGDLGDARETGSSRRPFGRGGPDVADDWGAKAAARRRRGRRAPLLRGASGRMGKSSSERTHEDEGWRDRSPASKARPCSSRAVLCAEDVGSPGGRLSAWEPARRDSAYFVNALSRAAVAGATNAWSRLVSQDAAYTRRTVRPCNEPSR